MVECSAFMDQHIGWRFGPWQTGLLTAAETIRVDDAQTFDVLRLARPLLPRATLVLFGSAMARKLKVWGFGAYECHARKMLTGAGLVAPTYCRTTYATTRGL